jgi:hypothetical protein
MKHSGGQTLLDVVLIVGAPLVLAIVELFHPHADDLLRLDVSTWLAVHYAQIALFPLTALALTWLVRARTDFAAVLCRVAMFVFGVGWAAWDSVAGVATGILAQSAHASGSPDAWRAALDALWANPIMGGRLALFAALGAVALSIGTVTAGISLKLDGSSWSPVILLALSGFGITIFQTHAWPGGPLTFGGIAIAGAWLLRERARQRSNAMHSQPTVTAESPSRSG